MVISPIYLTGQSQIYLTAGGSAVIPDDTSSGVASYNPYGSDIVIDAFERCGIYELETKHLFSARRSLNLLLASKWANNGINLWKIDAEPTTIPLIEGVLAYQLTSDIIAVFDTYRRQIPLGPQQNVTPDVSTILDSNVVTVGLLNAGVGPSNYVSFSVPISAGGLILSGFYQVLDSPAPNSFRIVTPTLATATVSNVGSVPTFTATAGQTDVSVLLPTHGMTSGQAFNVGVQTNVGGISLSGLYQILSVTDANNFVIGVPSAATSSGTAQENSGLAQIATQQINANPTDILMTPISRTDYASQANKFNPGAPTTYWVNRQRTPQVTLWPVTDNTGPYEMRMYCMRQIFDANPQNGQTLDLPQRMIYAATCDLARDLSIKWAPTKYAMLKEEADEAWEQAADSDVEHTSTFIMPNMPSGLG